MCIPYVKADLLLPSYFPTKIEPNSTKFTKYHCGNCKNIDTCKIKRINNTLKHYFCFKHSKITGDFD